MDVESKGGGKHRFVLRVASDVLWATMVFTFVVACVHIGYVFRDKWSAEHQRIQRVEQAHAHNCLHERLTLDVRRANYEICERMDSQRRESAFHLALVGTWQEEAGHITVTLFPIGWFAYFLCATVALFLFVIWRGQVQQYHHYAPAPHPGGGGDPSSLFKYLLPDWFDSVLSRLKPNDRRV